MPVDLPRHVLIHGWGEEGAAAIAHFHEREPDVSTTLLAQQPARVPDGLRARVGCIVDEAQFAASPAEYAHSGDLYLRSPGIPQSHPAVAAALRLGLRVTTPTGYWLEAQPSERVLVITGSKGKSTTTSLTHALLIAAGRSSLLLGNIGVAALGAGQSSAECFVLELSSYQLSDLVARPHACTLTNLYTEHTDWHGSHDAYIRAKLGPLLRHGDVPYLIRRRDEAELRAGAGRPLPDRAFACIEDYATMTTGIDGAPLLRIAGVEEPLVLAAIQPRFASTILAENLAVAAATAIHAGWLSPQQCADAVRAGLRHWVPLSHRRELLVTGDGRHWVDDSLATIPEAALGAVDEWTGSQVYLLIGGRDRGQIWAPMVDALAGQAQVRVLAFGEVRASLQAALNRQAIGAQARARYTFFSDLPEALAHAAALAPRDAVILFSPAAASAPPYASYKERSAAFRAAALAAPPAA